MGDTGDDAGPTDTIDERVNGLRRRSRPSARYALGHELGHGGMGEVIAARDEQIGRDVAIKRMLKADPSERAVARFLREARVQGRLEHPSIVPVHEIGRDVDNLPFFSMKKLAGTTLHHAIANTPDVTYPRLRLLRAFVDVCNAIELAHTRGVIHRDIKPANIMLGDFGEVYVLDWGVAKVTGEGDLDGSKITSDDDLATTVGMAVGTPAYMAPEQARGEADLDGRADVYSLGCVLFEILTRQQFHSLKGLAAAPGDATVTEIPVDHRRPAKRTPERDVPPELDDLCAAATEPDRANRPARARELGEAVQRFLDGDRDLAMRKSLAQQHLDRAQAAFTDRESEDQRRSAIREAGRALALDPTLAAAANLVSRLMIEPPATTPREVEAAIAADDLLHYKNHGRTSAITYALYLGFIPMWFWVAPIENSIVLTGLLMLNWGLVIVASRGTVVPCTLSWAGVAVFVGAVAWTFSPLFLAPGLAALIAMAFTMDPRLNRPHMGILLAGLMIVGVLGPWAAELVGLLPKTMTIDDAGVLFHAPGLSRMQHWFSAMYAIALITVVVALGYGAASSSRTTRRQLQIQAWQLRQLVVE